MTQRTDKPGGLDGATPANTARPLRDWPDLPVGVKNGIAARIDNRLIVGLGSAGAKVFALDLHDRAAGWQPLADFEGPAPSDSATAASGGALYVFGGAGNATPEARFPTVLDTVSRYDPKANNWQLLDTTTPVGLLGASAVTLADGRIAFFGGYNKALFDTYLADITAIDKTTDSEGWNAVLAAFMGMEPQDYHWNDRVLVYDTATNTWGDLGADPALPNTGSAVVETTPGSFLIINGEIKPGLRTNTVKSATIASNTVTWSEVAAIPAPEGSDVQEGLAGAYAGMSHGAVLVTGGANFQGARAKADAGAWYAHEGLSKHWASEIFALRDGQWTQVGTLPKGLAYGGSFSVNDGLLIVGGEDAAKAACTDVFLVQWDGEKLVIVD